MRVRKYLQILHILTFYSFNDCLIDHAVSDRVVKARRVQRHVLLL